MKIVAVIIGLSCSSTLACAEVSDDLKFCGSLRSGAERLACYDAAARIAARPATVRPVARVAPVDAQAAMPIKATVLDPLPARNPFDGYYAAIGGGYGVGSGRDASMNVNFFGSGGFTSSSGPSASLVAGRNIAVGWGIVGIEVGARWKGEEGGSIRQSGMNAYNYVNDIGVNAAIRAGVTFEDFLIYAKAGLGATRVRESFAVDERSINFCTSFDVFIGCTASTPGQLYLAGTASWLPTAVFGVGVERNWGPVFARLSADFEVFNHATTIVNTSTISGSSNSKEITWTTRGTALIGVRF